MRNAECGVRNAERGMKMPKREAMWRRHSCLRAAEGDR
jgi:hypothetical protein